jgi:imidazolonepropionase-like amidohydrolase
MIKLIVASTMMLFASTTPAQDELPAQTLFTNVNIFNGTENKLYENHSVLVEGNIIKTISAGAITPNAGATMIDGRGRTLMPGLIESHVHLNLQLMVGGYDTIEQRDWQEIGAMAANVARSLLMDGWTTVRDPGGTLTGMRIAIDRGDALGPRLYAANAVITQTSGHGDFRLRGQRRLEDRYTFKGGQLGMTHIVDGYDAHLSAARQNLANGAAFNKMMLSGGIFSSKDPLHTRQSTDDEVRAVIEASEAWGTYVTAHIFRAEDAQRGIRLGLKEIMHIPFLDNETARMLVDNGVYYNPQIAASGPESLEVIFGPGESVNKAKAREAQQGMLNVVGILRDMPELMEITAFGVDVVTSRPPDALRQRDFEMYFWAKNFGNFATLRSMTSIGGQVAALTGKLNPYLTGPLGVIEKGAYADILLIDGNPLDDITLLGGSSDQFTAADRQAGDIPAMKLIMKDGKIYKNSL